MTELEATLLMMRLVVAVAGVKVTVTSVALKAGSSRWPRALKGTSGWWLCSMSEDTMNTRGRKSRDRIHSCSRESREEKLMAAQKGIKRGIRSLWG